MGGAGAGGYEKGSGAGRDYRPVVPEPLRFNPDAYFLAVFFLAGFLALGGSQATMRHMLDSSSMPRRGKQPTQQRVVPSLSYFALYTNYSNLIT